MTSAINAALDALADIAAAEHIPEDWIAQTEGYSPHPVMSMRQEDMAVVAHILRQVAPCRLLEIGAGASTSYLFELNRGGLNISLEDDPEFESDLAASLPGGLGIVLGYQTQFLQPESEAPRRTDWRGKVKAQIDPANPTSHDYRRLQKRAVVPDWLWSLEFDLILVDGPKGAAYDAPGRSGTIYLAARLAAQRAVVVVDDLERPVEREFLEKFFPGRFLSVMPSGRLGVVV